MRPSDADQYAGPDGPRRNPGPDERVALCVARFYEELADKLEQGARAALADGGITDADRFDVPGAFELPLVAKYAAQSGRYVAVDGSSRMALAAAGADGRLLGREDRAHREPDSAAARRTRSGGGRVVKPKGAAAKRVGS